MITLINLFLDLELDYGWIECLQLSAKACGKGSVSHAQNLQKWVAAYLQHGILPVNHYGHFNTSILDSEDPTQQIHLHLIGISKKGYICAQDVVDVMSSPDMRQYLGTKLGLASE